jgi:hypothetical protein
MLAVSAARFPRRLKHSAPIKRTVSLPYKHVYQILLRLRRIIIILSCLSMNCCFYAHTLALSFSIAHCTQLIPTHFAIKISRYLAERSQEVSALLLRSSIVQRRNWKFQPCEDSFPQRSSHDQKSYQTGSNLGIEVDSISNGPCVRSRQSYSRLLRKSQSEQRHQPRPRLFVTICT